MRRSGRTAWRHPQTRRLAPQGVTSSGLGASLAGMRVLIGDSYGQESCKGWSTFLSISGRR